MRTLAPRLALRPMAAAALLVFFAPSGPARADGPGASAGSSDSDGGQRALGVGATVGFWSGAGVVAGGGSERVKGWVTAGYLPVFVFANAKTADKAVKFDGYSALQVGAEVGFPVLTRERFDLSLVLGYRFNTVIGHGGGAGARVLYDLTKRLSLGVVGGLQVFPDARRLLDEEHDYPADRTPALTPALQGGLSLELVWFP